MFKKPLSNLKTSAPLRSSDRRKLKQRIVATFSLTPDDGELLVPDGLLSVKFSTHLDEPGVAYLSPEGDPLWFTIGRGADLELTPTVYTLWKRPSLLPVLTTPAAVIPVLVGGADLMIPGVVTHPSLLEPSQLVAVAQYHDAEKRNVPLAVGTMAVATSGLADGAKGKAVHVLHTWKDHLWEMGPSHGQDVPPASAAVEEGSDPQASDDPGAAIAINVDAQSDPNDPPAHEASLAQADPVTHIPPQEVSDILQQSLLQAISTTAGELGPGDFPMPASTFYTAHILPARPIGASSQDSSTPIDIKHSTHKSLSAFLKLADKSGLLKLKETKGDLLVVGVFPKHPAVAGHCSYTTVGDVERKAKKKEERDKERREEGAKREKEMHVTELWKPTPQNGTMKFFEEINQNTTALYTLPDLKTVLNNYIASENLLNPRDRAYVAIDARLRAALHTKPKKGAEEVPSASGATEWVKREELVRRLIEKMQGWHQIDIEGGQGTPKKGVLKPIQVATKVRQGRKASTLITGFEPFGLDAASLAEELRRVCAGATSVSQPLGSANSAGLEVLVQGKQIKAVVDALLDRGVPTKWIETSDLSGKKKYCT